VEQEAAMGLDSARSAAGTTVPDASIAASSGQIT